MNNRKRLALMVALLLVLLWGWAYARSPHCQTYNFEAVACTDDGRCWSTPLTVEYCQ
jgi:hypothetical protein